MHPPTVHRNDKPLLRPLASLGKTKSMDAGVSFLRRTEYISSHASKSHFKSTTSRTLAGAITAKAKTLPTNIDHESPEYIKARVERSFDIARAKLENPSSITHPIKGRSVKMKHVLPLLPDLDGFSDFGGYLTIKFSTKPVTTTTAYDERLESAIIRPMELSPEAEAAQVAAQERHERNPDIYPAPELEQNYEFYLPEDAESAKNYKRKCNVFDAEHDSEDLYTTTNSLGRKVFRFTRVREYETAGTVDQMATKYDTELAFVASGSGSRDGKRIKAMHYYPIIQKNTIRPQRNRNMNKVLERSSAAEDDLHLIDVRVVAPDQETLNLREAWRVNPLRHPMEEEEGTVDVVAPDAAAAELRSSADAEDESDPDNVDVDARNGSAKAGEAAPVDVDASGSDE
jgi:RNA polymerase II-associated factor 1